MKPIRRSIPHSLSPALVPLLPLSCRRRRPRPISSRALAAELPPRTGTWPSAAAGGGGAKGGGAGALMKGFTDANDAAVTVSLGSAGALAYSSANKNPLVPRMFGSVNDIFCLFQGHVENIGNLKQHYGLSKTANEVTILIEAYRTLRDKGPLLASQVVRDLSGRFAFILYDTVSKSTFVAADADGSIPFFWGVDSENHLVFSDDNELLKAGCGNSFAPFPKGCFYTTSGGLQSFEHPLNELKAVPRVDSQGQMCGSTFKVDTAQQLDQLVSPSLQQTAPEGATMVRLE